MIRHNNAARCAGIVAAGLVAAGSATAATAPALAGVRAVQAVSLWGRAVGVPGLAALAAGRGAGVEFVSCPSAGNCAVAGAYGFRSRRFLGFVASERNGR